MANDSYDLGGNSGWTINSTTAKDYYWVGGGGDWNDGSHWSLSSGGSGSGCVPTFQDNVYFDANSFSAAGQTVSVNAIPAYSKSMDWTGVTNGPEFDIDNELNVYGSLTFSPNMTVVE